jgi:hypothetical protein
MEKTRWNIKWKGITEDNRKLLECLVIGSVHFEYEGRNKACCFPSFCPVWLPCNTSVTINDVNKPSFTQLQCSAKEVHQCTHYCSRGDSVQMRTVINRRLADEWVGRGSRHGSIYCHTVNIISQLRYLVARCLFSCLNSAFGLHNASVFLLPTQSARFCPGYIQYVTCDRSLRELATVAAEVLATPCWNNCPVFNLE